MELIPYVVAYIAVGIFVVACLARFFMWSKMPMHMRWELYPVAHEPGRAHYGGSYLEEVDWWKKPRHSSLWGELKAMVPEILFLVALKENNKKMWNVSFPFHFGLYLVIGCTGLMMGSAVLGAISPAILAGGFGKLLRVAIMACGYGGLGLSLLGALGLLSRRLGDAELKDFTSPADIFNLVFFLLAFGFTLANLVLFDRDFSRTFAFVYGLVTFNMVPLPGGSTQAWMTTISVVLMGALVAYIPMTHMSHFIGKYFAYHAIRWNDEPNLKGGDQEAPINDLLHRPVSWSAPHIQGDGKKTWADVATQDFSKGNAQ
jgi:nitrate reductase gamma subunit